jgi:hypothetical protein
VPDACHTPSGTVAALGIVRLALLAPPVASRAPEVDHGRHPTATPRAPHLVRGADGTRSSRHHDGADATRGSHDLATKHDLAALERRIDARFDAQDARFDAKLEAMRSSTLRTVGTWLFASQAAVITAIGIATGVIVALS